jgi:RHS repeat-associated protein
LFASFALAALTPLPVAADVIEYYHTDAVGNVRVVTDGAGTALERHDYMPFGEEPNPGAASQPLRFTGKERDAETGLGYFGARYYGSQTGRFTTTDPAMTTKENILDSQRWNRYAYARNNPLRFVDPDGRDWIEYKGQTLTWYGGAAGDRTSPSGTYPASSGLPGHQVPSEQATRDAGPVPEGSYFVALGPDPARIAKADSRTGELVANPNGGIEQIPLSFTTRSGDTYTYGAQGTGGAWGNTRAALQPGRATDTKGRFGFYLHDSDKGYSHGCTDTKPAVLQRLIQYRQDHPSEKRFEVRVRYADPTTKKQVP